MAEAAAAQQQQRCHGGGGGSRLGGRGDGGSSSGGGDRGSGNKGSGVGNEGSGGNRGSAVAPACVMLYCTLGLEDRRLGLFFFKSYVASYGYVRRPGTDRIP